MRRFNDDIELRDGSIVDVELIFYGDELRCIYCPKLERLIKVTELVMPLDYIVNKYKGR